MCVLHLCPFVTDCILFDLDFGTLWKLRHKWLGHMLRHTAMLHDVFEGRVLGKDKGNLIGLTVAIQSAIDGRARTQRTMDMFFSTLSFFPFLLFFSSSFLFLFCIIITWNRASANDSAYSCTFLCSMVCRLSHSSPCLNCSTDLDAIWQVHLGV